MKKPLIDRTTGENVVAFGRPLAEDGGVLPVERPKSDAVKEWTENLRVRT